MTALLLRLAVGVGRHVTLRRVRIYDRLPLRGVDCWVVWRRRLSNGDVLTVRVARDRARP